MIRAQTLKIEKRTLIPANVESYTYTIQIVTGTTKTEAETISRELEISMGGNFKKFSTEINQKLGYSSSKTFVTYEEKTVTTEIKFKTEDYDRQFVYAQVLDLLKVIDVPSDAIISELSSGTVDDGYFLTNQEGELVQLHDPVINQYP